MSKYGVISGPYFPDFGLNTAIYKVNFRIQFEYRKIRTRNNSVFGHYSHSNDVSNYQKHLRELTTEIYKSLTDLKPRVYKIVFYSQRNTIHLTQWKYFKSAIGKDCVLRYQFNSFQSMSSVEWVTNFHQTTSVTFWI